MVRKDWEFGFTAETLLDLAIAQVQGAISKVKEWKEKRDDLKRQIEEAGLRWHEAVAHANSTMTQVASQPMVDNSLLSSYRDAETRVEFHQNREMEFRRWVALLQKETPGRIIYLNYEDSTYFGVYDAETRP